MFAQLIIIDRQSSYASGHDHPALAANYGQFSRLSYLGQCRHCRSQHIICRHVNSIYFADQTLSSLLDVIDIRYSRFLYLHALLCRIFFQQLRLQL